MTPFTLSTGTRGPQPREFGPYGYRCPEAVGGYRLTPEGLDLAREFLGRYVPVAKLAFVSAQTRRMAHRYMTEYGADELIALCNVCVLEAVRRFEPGRLSASGFRCDDLATVVGWEIYGSLTRLYDARHCRPSVPRVSTNCYGTDDSGDEFSELGFIADRPAAGHAEAADDLAELARVARKQHPSARRQVWAAVEFYGKGRTLTDIGADIGKTKERARQLAVAGLRRLRDAAGLDPFEHPTGKYELKRPPKRTSKPRKPRRGPDTQACPSCASPAGVWCVRDGVKCRHYCRERLTHPRSS